MGSGFAPHENCCLPLGSNCQSFVSRGGASKILMPLWLSFNFLITMPTRLVMETHDKSLLHALYDFEINISFFEKFCRVLRWTTPLPALVH